MNFVVIILASLVALAITRIPFILLFNSQKELHKAFERVLLSFGMLGIFIVIWSVIVAKYMSTKQVINNLVWYCIFTFFGIAAIIWCYFRWDLKWKAKPELETEKIILALKKTFVFTLVMIFAFYHGYRQMDAAFKQIKVDSNLTVYNVTLISGIIALDRVLNQATTAYKEWKTIHKSKNKDKESI